jgi:hypothetical protein
VAQLRARCEQMLIGPLVIPERLDPQRSHGSQF